VRRLGSQAQTVMSLDAMLEAMLDEATPPDLKRVKAARAAKAAG
jgi:threonyl-tRNA synthetase